MKKSLLLSAALALVILPAPGSLKAQEVGVDRSSPNTRAAKRAQQAKKEQKAGKPAPLFPKATREEPEAVGAKALSKDLAALFDLQEKEGSEDEQIAKADAILADKRATPFDRSSAGYIAGYAWLNKDAKGYANASKYIKGAIDDNGLGNNTHYQMMLQLAQMMESEDKAAEGLVYVDRYLAETKSEDPKAYSLKAAILIDQNKAPEAAAVLEQVLKAKPGDKSVMRNLASIYEQSGQDAKAGEMIDRMRRGGLLTEAKDYETAWRLMANLEGHGGDAMAIIDEGLKSGVMQPSYEMYSFQGQTYYAAEQVDKAMDAWTKGAPMSKNGEMYLNLSKLQVDAEKWTAAKTSAKSALAKGVKKSGDAWQVIGRSEAGLENKAAAVAAYKEAAKYPETKKWAESVLRQASGK